MRLHDSVVGVARDKSSVCAPTSNPLRPAVCCGVGRWRPDAQLIRTQSRRASVPHRDGYHRNAKS
jgi:hypothetical protein